MLQSRCHLCPLLCLLRRIDGWIDDATVAFKNIRPKFTLLLLPWSERLQERVFPLPRNVHTFAESNSSFFGSQAASLLALRRLSTPSACVRTPPKTPPALPNCCGCGCVWRTGLHPRVGRYVQGQHRQGRREHADLGKGSLEGAQPTEPAFRGRKEE